MRLAKDLFVLLLFDADRAIYLFFTRKLVLLLFLGPLPGLEAPGLRFGGPFAGAGSRKRQLIFRGKVDLSAANGRAGNLLLDPDDGSIVGGTGDGSDLLDVSASQNSDILNAGALLASRMNTIFSLPMLVFMVGTTHFPYDVVDNSGGKRGLYWAIMLVVWIRDNLPDRYDMAWLRAGGGFFNNSHPDAARFNAGQKLIFWSVALGGIALSVTGIIMLFPFSVADINGMQWAQYINAIVGVILIAIMIAHIYIGSLGMEGAYDAMGSGEVDLAWARRHHRAWVDEQQAKTASGPQVGGRAPAPAE